MNKNKRVAKSIRQQTKTITKIGVASLTTMMAAGMVTGLTTVPVFASPTEADTLAANVEAAEQAMNTAQETYNQASEEVAVAQANLEDAQAKADQAQVNYDTAVANANQAFNTLETNAVNADTTATNDLATANQNLATAQADVTTAGQTVQAQEQAVQTADTNLATAQQNCNVTPEQIQNQEQALQTAQANEETARLADVAAQGVVDEKTAAVTTAQQTVETKTDDKNSAYTDYQTATDAVNTIQTEYDGYSNDIALLNERRNDPTLLDNTAEGQVESAAKTALTTAQGTAATAEQEKSDADTAYTNAGDITSEKQTELSNAQSTAQQAEADKNTKETASALAAQQAQQASADAYTAQINADNAMATLTTATNENNAAQTALLDAQTAQTNAESTAATKLTEYNNAVTTATSNYQTSQNQYDSVVIANKQALENTQAELTRIQQLRETNMPLGTMGLMNWVMTQTEDADQLADLNNAIQVLQAAQEDLFANHTGIGGTSHYMAKTYENRSGDEVVIIGDEKDATSLKNFQSALDILTEVNKVRATDENYANLGIDPFGKTNFYMMAYTAVRTMLAADLHTHASGYKYAENIASGHAKYDAETQSYVLDVDKLMYGGVSWYTQEKGVFDEARDRYFNQEGITEITSRSQINDIERMATDVTGHYTNLLNTTTPLMGAGFTNYRSTSGFNITSAPSLAQTNYGKAQYTVEEMQGLLNQYLATMDTTTAQANVNTAQTTYNNSVTEADTFRANKDTYISNAVTNEKSALDTANQAVTDAQANTATAQTTANEKADALLSATDANAVAQQDLTTANQNKQTAILNAQTAENEATQANNVYLQAQQTVAAAEQALQTAQTNEQNALNVLNQKTDAYNAAQIDLTIKQQEYNEAKAALDALTSDATLTALQNNQADASTRLTNARQTQNDKMLAYDTAAQDLQNAENALADAQNNLNAAYQDKQTAEQNYAAAQGVTTTTAQDLQAMNEAYAPLAQAIADKTQADADLLAAQNALTDAETRLRQAQEIVQRCQDTKNATAAELQEVQELLEGLTTESVIENQKYDDLNTYTTEVRNTKQNLEAMQRLLSEANGTYNQLNDKKQDAWAKCVNAQANLDVARTLAEEAQRKADEEARKQAEQQNNTGAGSGSGQNTNQGQNQSSSSGQNQGINQSQSGTNTSAENESQPEANTQEAVALSDINRSLGYGSTGDDVSAVQDALARAGYYSGTRDGEFGPVTRRAVEAFQRANGLYVDGVVGPQTLKALTQNANQSAPAVNANTNLNYGATGTYVTALQNMLKALGFNPGPIDGYYGNQTRSAVLLYQMANGLYVDGVAGPITMNALAGAVSNPNTYTDNHDYAVNDINENLQYGSQGEAVKVLQTRLNELGYKAGAVDGDFGPVTKQAVEAYQRDHGLYVDGMVGPITRASLHTTNTNFASIMNGTELQFGSRGTAVETLQYRLQALGFNPGPIDGYYGNMTQQAVKDYQKDHGLYVDGIAGPITLGDMKLIG